MKNGFYIVLVTNGTATLSASDHTHNIGSRDLVIMTPSMECSVVPSGRDFSMTCIYMRPDYFDALPAGQSIYGQLPRFTARYGVAISHLAAEDYEYLCLTMRLFSDRLQDTDRYGNGARVHLCSFMLLHFGYDTPMQPRHRIVLHKTLDGTVPQLQETGCRPLPVTPRHCVLRRPAQHIDHVSVTDSQGHERTYGQVPPF